MSVYDSNFLCFGDDNHLTISLQKLLTGTSVFFIKETNFGSIILWIIGELTIKTI